MKFGRSYIAQPISVGCGLHYVGVLARLLPLFQGIIVLKLAPNYGQRFHSLTNTVIPSVISGMLMPRYFLKQHIAHLVKVQVKPITWNVGIVPCVNALLALFAKPYPSPNLTSCTKLFSSVSSLIIISLVSVSFEPRPIFPLDINTAM